MFRKDNKLNIEYFYKKLKNGLKVYFINKENVSKTFAIYATKYGSLDQEFIPNGESEFVKTPMGIAHYLEHKLFELEDGTDASDLFLELGADSNAFTTYDMTGYMFETVDNIKESLDILLDFVAKPSFDDEGIEKERLIITEELKMYLDKPSTALYVGLLKTMYKINEVREEIGGTTSSIKEIDKRLLKMCHNTFYHPSNMVLVLASDFKNNQLDVDDLIKQIENKFNDDLVDSKIKRKYHLENNVVYKKTDSKKMDIVIPKTATGIKIDVNNLSEKELIKKELLLTILMDIYFDTSGQYYNTLENLKLINNSFDYEVVLNRNYGYLFVKNDTLKIDEYNQKIKEMLLDIKEKKILEEVFIRHKKVLYSEYIKKVNSLNFVVDMFIEEAFKNVDAFLMFELIKSLKYEDLNEVLEYFVEDAICTFTIYSE